VDTFYTIFVEGVARNRGTSTENVLEHMADGADYVGRQSLENGLVDYIGGFDYAVSLTKKKGAKKMDLNTLKAENLSLYQEVFDLGAKSVDQVAVAAEAEKAGVEAGKKEGIETERKRVMDILDAGADYEVTKTAIKDGTSADGAYKLFYEAVQTKKAKGIDKMEEEAPEPVGQEEPEEPEAEDKTPKDLQLARKAKDLAVKEGITIVDAMNRLSAEDPELAREAFPEAVSV